MKREIFTHFAILVSFFVLISLFRGYLQLSYWPFWVGGLLGTMLPDLDHLIYALFLDPQELTAQRVGYLLQNRNVGRVISLLYETRYERKSLIFHTYLFQILFWIVTFLVLASSTSIFARGVILAFCVHLAVDQLTDITEIKNLGNWGKLFPTELSYKQSIMYVVASFLLVCIAGFLM